MYFLCLLFVPLLMFSCLNANTVLITGANRGIGLEFAEQYKAKGYNVIGTARRPKEAEDLKALGVRVEQLDVADAESVQALANKLQRVPIDILINNAGIFPNRSARIETVDFDDMDSAFAVNATGPVRVTQALLNNLRLGKEKKIVNITSQLGSIENNTGGMYSYRASKAALNQLTKTISLDLGREGFICIALHPGWVRTDMGGMMATYSPKESVSAMIQLIENLDKKSNGSYLDLHGKKLPW